MSSGWHYLLLTLGRVGLSRRLSRANCRPDSSKTVWTIRFQAKSQTAEDQNASAFKGFGSQQANPDWLEKSQKRALQSGFGMFRNRIEGGNSKTKWGALIGWKISQKGCFNPPRDIMSQSCNEIIMRIVLRSKRQFRRYKLNAESAVL